MKHSKLILFFISLLSVSFANAQKELPDSTSFMFDSNGGLTRVVATQTEAKAKMITINPRIEDVIWRKMVLRVIDLRELNNRSLYYPIENIDEESQKNLFAIIFKNWVKGELPSYQKVGDGDLDVPDFTNENRLDPVKKINSWLNKDAIANSWDLGAITDLNDLDENQIYKMINSLSKGIIKYAVQEIWYFDKSTSTVQNKIVAIAPFFDYRYGSWPDAGLTGSISSRNGDWGWFSYEQLRPFLHQEFIRMNGKNIAPLVNFDDFFTKRMFTGYIIRDYDLKNSLLDEDLKDFTEEDVQKIRQEQQRIEDEILNFEMDLWSY